MTCHRSHYSTSSSLDRRRAGLRATIGGIAGIVAAVQLCVVEDPVGESPCAWPLKSELIIASDPGIRC